MHCRFVIVVVFFLGMLPTVASAHPQHAIGNHGGMVAGLTHPLFGPDHLLAMLAIGFLGAQLAGRALWLLPTGFVGAMVLGGMAGMAGWEWPVVEPVIVASVVVFGLAVALGRRFPLAAMMSLVALFGLFHGHAHGTEMPVIAQPALYATGFVLATAGLHLAGVLGGRFALRSARGAFGLRLAGVATACIGLALCF